MDTLQSLVTEAGFIARLEQKVREIAASNPEYVYGKRYPERLLSCTYADTGDSCACLIGLALVALGVPNGELAQVDRRQGLDSASIGAVLEHLGSTEDSTWLNDVQGSQDGRVPWGSAVERADAAAASRLVLSEERS